MDSADIVIPYTPRGLFAAFHGRRQRFSCEVVHRRGGKTVSRVNELIRCALTEPLERPRFAYIAPYLKQAKAVVWDYLKHYSAPFVEHGAVFRESELRVDYPNGAQVRLYGADNPDALRGIYLDGVVFDEYGTMDPRIWPVVRPALSDRVGWADFCPEPMPHTVYGRCPADRLAGIQKIQTVLVRQANDNLFLSNTPQREVVMDWIVKPDQLINMAPGAPVLVKQPGRSARSRSRLSPTRRWR